MINNIFSEELTQALGWTMIHSLWQGFVVAILMGLAMIGLQKKSAKVRYELAWFALFLVLVLSLSTFIYLYDSATSGEVLGNTISVIAEGGIILENGNTVQTFFQKIITYFNEHLPLIVTLWFVGMFFFLLRLIGGLAYIEKLKSQKQNKLPESWERTFKNLQARFPIKKTIQIAESSLAKVPMVIGYLKPMILFPMGAINQLNQQEVEAVLAHELAHIYRNDYLLNIIQSLIETIFYYHPAVWWISANIRTERENCCDDIAVKLCGNSLTYVKALVSLEEMQPAPSLAMSFSSGRKNQLLNRVKRILNQPQNKFNIMEKFTATSFLLVALLLFSVSATQPEKSKLEDEPRFTETETITEVATEAEPLAEITQDTFPKRKKERKAVYEKNNEKVEIRFDENDEVEWLRINGEEIPQDEIANYVDYVEELIDDVPMPPMPPMNYPVAPPAPPQMDFYPSDNKTTAEFDNQNKKIIITTDEDGNTVIISDSYEEGEDTHVVFGQGELSLNGRVIQMDELPLVFGDEDMKVAFPDIKFMTEGGVQIRTFDSEELALPSLADIPAFLDDFNLAELDKLSVDPFDNIDFGLPGLDLDNFGLPGFDFDTIPDGNLWINGDEVDWDNLSEEERKEYEAKLSEAKKSMEEAKRHLKEEMKRVKEINTEEFEQQMAEAKAKIKEARAMQKEQQKELRKQMKEVREQHREQIEMAREKRQEVMREVRERQRMERTDWTKSLEQQLSQDGHIKSDGSYSFSLSNKRLKINGKKQAESEREKYRKLYENSTGKDLGTDFKIKVSTDGKNNKTTSVSVTDNSN